MKPTHADKMDQAIAQSERVAAVERKLTNQQAIRGKWYQYAKKRQQENAATKRK